jgi:hypothetical protein
MQLLEEYYLIDNHVENGPSGQTGPQQKSLNNSGPKGPDGPDVPSVPPVIYNCPHCETVCGNESLLELHLRTKHRYKGDDEKDVESNK